MKGQRHEGHMSMRRPGRGRRAAAGAALALGALLLAVPAGAAPPDGRAYELVSPVNRNLGDVVAATAATGDGDGIAYNSAAVDDARGAQFLGEGIARRSAQGWTTTDGSAAALGGALPASVTYPLGIAPDLSRLAIYGSFAFDAQDTDGPFSADLYALTPGTGETSRLTTGADSDVANNALTYFGNSTDLRRSFFTGGGIELIPGAPLTSYFEHTPDGLRVASVLPNGTDAPAPGVVAKASQMSGMDAANAQNWVPAPYGGAHVVSDDGSRFFFKTGFLLLMREGGATTLPISASQKAGSVGNASTNMTFVAASHDGGTVYFVSANPLTDTATTGGGLYRYTVGTGELRQLTPNPGGPNAGIRDAVMSDDASHVYFFSTKVLAPGGTPGQQNLYVWSGDTTRYVAGFATNTQSLIQRVSRDGRYVAITSTTSVGGASNDGHVALYRWDDTAAQLACASCRPGGAASQGDAVLKTQMQGLYAAGAISSPRTLSDTGRVFFSTNDQLVPDDLNHAYDVYEYDDAGVRLISDGRGDQDSWVSDNSDDGSDVFFTTRRSLVAADTDGGLYSLYDARVGGGLADPPRLHDGCRAESCQGPASQDPELPPAASALTGGPGNRTWAPPAQRLRLLRLPAPARARWARTGVVRVTARVAGGGLVQLRARAPIGGRVRTVGTASAMVATSGPATVRIPLELSPAARRELQRTRRLELTVAAQLGRQPGRAFAVTLTRARG